MWLNRFLLGIATIHLRQNRGGNEAQEVINNKRGGALLVILVNTWNSYGVDTNGCRGTREALSTYLQHGIVKSSPQRFAFLTTRVLGNVLANV